ncbi:MAG: DMT family transporter [Halopseudomonas aestusnigri]
MMRKSPRIGITLAFICLFILGVMPIISNSRPNSFDALSFAFFLSLWQLVFSVPLLVWELKFSDKGIFAAQLPSRLKIRTIVIILLTGIIFGLSTYVYVLAVEKAGAVSAVIAIQAYPLFAILWETLFLKRRKTSVELFFTFILLVALYFLATKGTFRIEGLSFWFLLALSIPFLWSVAHVIIKEVLDKTPITPVQITFFRVLVSTVFLMIVLIIVDGPASIIQSIGEVSFQKIAIVMGFVYYVELINWFYAVRHVDVSVASSITAPSPVVTMLLAIMFLNVEVETYQLIALSIVLLSVYGLLFAGRRKAVVSVSFDAEQVRSGAES